jgi:hypothetical protein
MGKQYKPNWGGKRIPTVMDKQEKDSVNLKGDRVRLLKRIGGGDFNKGLNTVLKEWKHF